MAHPLWHLIWIVPGFVLGGALLLARNAGDGIDDGPPRTALAQPSDEISWERTVEVATGEAYQGPWRMNDSDFRYVDAPSVALTPEGSAVVVWVDQAMKDILLQVWTQQGDPLLDEPVNISRSPDTFSWLPRVAVLDSEGKDIHILWQEIVFSGGSHGGEILHARSEDGGRTFSEPMNLSTSPAGAGKGRLTQNRWDNGSLELVRGPEGELHAIWTEYEGGLRVRSSTDGGRSFSEAVEVVRAGTEEPARAPAGAVDLHGTLHLVWTVGEDPSADLRYASSRDGARSFSEPVTLAPGDGHADGPALTAAADGTLHLVWGKAAEGPDGPYRLRHLHWEGGADPRDASPSSVPDGIGEGVESAAFPVVGGDGAGNLYVVWERFESFDQRPVGLGFARWGSGAGAFGAPGLVPGTGEPQLGFNGSLQGLLGRKLAVNAEGRVAIVNGTFDPGRESRVRLILGRGR